MVQDEEPLPEPDTLWLPCCICNKNLVLVSEGYDTCQECLDKA
jgi:hypothetical protein